MADNGNEELGEQKRIFPSTLSAKAVLALCIMEMLSKKSQMYGYEIVERLNEMFTTKHNVRLWTISNGVIYPLLRQMEGDEILDSWWTDPHAWKRGKRYYRLTQRGFERWKRAKLTSEEMLMNSLEVIRIILKEVYGRDILAGRRADSSESTDGRKDVPEGR